MAPSIPLLHIGQTAAEFATVDLRLATLGVLLFAAALALVWLPRTPFRHGRAARRRTAAVVMTALVILAVLPSVFPYDHVFTLARHDGHTESSTIHVGHCHLNPGSCADAPVSAGPGQLMQSAPLILAPALLSVLVVLAIPALAGIVRPPELRPPLSPVNA